MTKPFKNAISYLSDTINTFGGVAMHLNDKRCEKNMYLIQPCNL